ncbi:MAG: folylpolyglutamate synthase/dihydrofolate synthase family protein [Pseudomonadota bacterium]
MTQHNLPVPGAKPAGEPSDGSGGALALLKQFSTLHPRAWDLGLERLERLLGELGHPERRLPSVFHIAGTNGKGSTVAFLRSCLEASARSVHAYTSPHLVRFNERIRVAGNLVSDADLLEALRHCETVNGAKPITFFEATTAVALWLFSKNAADATLLEVGLGGRLDATNVVQSPVMSAITPVSMDHMGFLGDTIEKIAAEKAGILKPGVPCVVANQRPEALEVIRAVAHRVGAPLIEQGQDYMVYEEHGRLVYQDGFGLLDLPLPRMHGRHQLENAGTAIACLRHTDFAVSDSEFAQGVQTAFWPARLQKLGGDLASLAPSCDVWVDGGHNAGGGQALAEAMADLEDRVPRPLYLVSGLMRTKSAVDFFRPFEGLARQVIGVPIPDQENALDPVTVAESASEAGTMGSISPSIEDALSEIESSAGEPARILICGSLYLAGSALSADGFVLE